ncbi:hypothetical protein NKDENANG_01040 [Candidatus Entotheonellaceae bacterium PAL068K]
MMRLQYLPGLMPLFYQRPIKHVAGPIRLSHRHTLFQQRNRDPCTRPSRHGARVAQAYPVSTKKIEPIKKRFVEEGYEAALYRQPVTNSHHQKMTGEEKARIEPSEKGNDNME